VPTTRMKKKSSKWFSPVSAAKFYGGLLVGAVCVVHSFVGIVTKPLDQIIQFDLFSGSPVMILVLGIVAFAIAYSSYKNQRW